MINCICFGEIIFDLINSKAILGGAPLNVAVHFSRLGGNSILLSAVGPDKRGKTALEKLKEERVNTEFISLVMLDTGYAEISLKEGKADYTFNYPAAWDEIKLSDKEIKKLKETQIDAIVYGTLSQRSAVNEVTLFKVMSELGIKERLLDVNLRKHFYSKSILSKSIEEATILKLSDEELPSVCFVLGIKVAPQALLEKFEKLKIVILTKGHDGAEAYSRAKTYTVNSQKVQVKDTVGAGDAFTAAFLYTYLKTRSIQSALEAGAVLSGYVVSTEGATATYGKEIKKLAELF